MFHTNLRRLLFTESIGVNYIRPTNSVGELNHVLSHFLPAGYAYVKSPSITLESSISPCRFISFCLIVGCYVVRHTHVKNCYALLENWPLYHYIIPTFPLIILLALKFVLSEINIPVPDVVQLVFAWYIFLYPFTFNPYGSLGL